MKVSHEAGVSKKLQRLAEGETRRAKRGAERYRMLACSEWLAGGETR
jgi:hypothetical protein